MRDLKMKIRGSETPDNPAGWIVTRNAARQWGERNMPADLRAAGFACTVFPGARGWSINYGKAIAATR